MFSFIFSSVSHGEWESENQTQSTSVPKALEKHRLEWRNDDFYFKHVNPRLAWFTFVE